VTDTGNLPAVASGTEVVEGVVVDEDAAPSSPVIVMLQRPVQVVQLVVRHEHTRRAGRNLSYIGAGAAIVAKRLWDERTTARYGRMLRSAEAQGNHEAALDWEERRLEFVRDRHQRRMDWAELPVKILLVLPKLVGSVVLLYVSLGFTFAFAGHASDFAVPFRVTGLVIFWTWVIVSVTWLWLVALAVVIGVAALWHTGRTTGGAGWDMAKKGDEEDGGMIVTADAIVVALQHLDKIAAMKKAFKDGWRPAFVTPPVRDGRGYEAEFAVPMGVTAEMIADQRAILARNLHRDEIETWPSAGAPGYVRLWVADRGAIGKAAPEYPLLHEGTADVFAGVPGGVIARGDGALIPVVAANGVLGGLMGQGKSNAARVVVLGCALDPLCGLDVFVFANNGDFDAYQPRLAVYRKGLDDDVITAAVDRLHEAYRDVGEREQMLADLGAKKLTRQLAEQYPELRPHVSLFSECHELFGSEKLVGKVRLGELAGELAVKIVKRQRKTGRAAWFDTQSSRKAAIPPALVELVSVNCCFAVKSWRSNDGFLGDGSFAAGIRATELRPGRDRGTSLVTGISDAQFELLKWYYIEVDDDTGYDAATDVIARAMKTVAPGTPVGASAPAAAIDRDLLGDLAAVLGPDRVRLADVPALLRDHAPGWGPYRGLNGKRLGELLDDEGVRWTNPRNVPTLDPADVRRVLNERGELDARNVRGMRLQQVADRVS
jgi:DNA segregation ATPase FtsK/SpoIIIE, S-DNA-T family